MWSPDKGPRPQEGSSPLGATQVGSERPQGHLLLIWAATRDRKGKVGPDHEFGPLVDGAGCNIGQLEP